MLIVADLALLLLATLRLVRLVVADDLGLWWLRGPAVKWATWHEPDADGWRSKLVLGLYCPFCVGFWIGCGVLVSLWLCGGPGHAVAAWRYICGTLALNWAAAHIGSRVGDAGED